MQGKKDFTPKLFYELSLDSLVSKPSNDLKYPFSPPKKNFRIL